FKELVPDVRVFEISAATKQGVQELMYAIAEQLATIPEKPQVEEVAEVEERVVFRAVPEPIPFEISVEDEVFLVSGDRIEKLVRMTNLTSYDS
ncbi:DUF1967 domain-containing protein, partial [Microbacteriaceae bacterium K1510]|nr:DUF1967 domain-containing protein [Microbacteriaceae bacterium K1510]